MEVIMWIIELFTIRMLRPFTRILAVLGVLAMLSMLGCQVLSRYRQSVKGGMSKSEAEKLAAEYQEARPKAVKDANGVLQPVCGNWYAKQQGPDMWAPQFDPGCPKMVSLQPGTKYYYRAYSGTSNGACIEKGSVNANNTPCALSGSQRHSR
jgi:hypothetical protein